MFFEESDVFNNFASRSLDRNIGNKKSQSRDVSSTTSKEFNSPPSPDFFDEPTLYQKRKTGLSLKKDRQNNGKFITFKQIRPLQEESKANMTYS